MNNYPYKQKRMTCDEKQRESPVRRLINEISCKSLQITHFTMLELLVTIAIIVIMASVLLPALGRARESAYQIQCTNRIKQLNTAVLLYCNDNDTNLPVLISPPPTELLINTHLLPYLGAQAITLPNILKFCCPSSYRLNASLDRHITNGDIFPYYSVGSAKWLDIELQPIKVGRIKESSRTFTFYCGQPMPNGTTISVSVYIDRLKIGGTYSNVGIVHKGNVNVGFVDGHVKSQRGAYGKYLDIAHDTALGASSTSNLSTLWK
jgi:prepilin-type processing-associated H-X9-DG protein